MTGAGDDRGGKTDGGPDGETGGETDGHHASESGLGHAGPESLARRYYRALDDGDYDLLEAVLASDFVHERPDRTLSGRDRFVRFMREERPQTDTSHPIDGVYVPANAGDGDEQEATEVVVRGRLLSAEGSEITAFVDVFLVADGALQRLRTFTA